MKTSKKEGFRRLAILIAAGSFFVTYLILWIVEESGGRVSEEEAFIQFPIVSIIVAGIIWGFTKGVYWVIDGFRKQNDK